MDNASESKETIKTDRRVLRTRQALRTALMELVQEKNYESISVEEITARANLGRATFYLHYRDKEDLLLEEFSTMANDRVRVLSELPVSVWTPDVSTVEPGRKPIMPLLQLFEHAAEHAELYRILLRGEGSQRMAQGIRDITTKAINDFFETKLQNEPLNIQPEVPVELLGAYFSGALLSTIRWWLEQDPQPTPAEMTRMFQRLFFPGVRKVFGLEKTA